MAQLCRFLLVPLGLVIASCSKEAWQPKEYGGIAAAHGDSRPAESRYLLKVLDGLAQLLYSGGFEFETNGPELRPARVFSDPALSEHQGDFVSQTSFFLIEAPTSEIRCVVQYDSRKEVWVTFEQFRVTSLATPRFPMSAVRRRQIDGLLNRIAVYLRTKLPGYHVVVSEPKEGTNQAMQVTATRYAFTF